MLFLTMLLLVPCFAGTKGEIAYLLDFIEQSGCVFLRNGRQYDSYEARKHIESKYHHFRREIAVAEDFIHYSATKSSVSGRPYKVLCNGESMNSEDWLNAELEKMRNR